MSHAHLQTSAREQSSGGRLSVEAGLWILLGVLALTLRLSHLGAAPLADSEAREALRAWRVATGQGWPVGHYNPFLLAGNALLFNLFGTSDVLARLVPAILGALLPLSPVLFRRQLGRFGALTAGLYLAISPTALVASRQLSGTAIAAGGAMAAASGIARFFEKRSRGGLTLAGVGLGLAVTSDATAYALLVPLGVAWILLSKPWRETCLSDLRHWATTIRPHIPRFLFAFVLVVLALSTGLGWNPPGIGAVGGLLVDWFGRFRSAPSPPVSVVTLLVVYELFGLLFGIGALVVGLRRRQRVAGLIGLWGALEVFLLSMMPGRLPVDLLWAVIPLALLVGLFTETLLREWSPSGGALSVAYAVLVLVVWAYGYLMVSRYTAFGDTADLALAIIAILVQALLGLSLGLALGASVALRTAVGATGLALLALTLSAAWGVAFNHPADPREPLLSEPTTLEMRSLVRTLQDLSWERTGMPRTLDFSFQAPEYSALAWYLRDFDGARRVDRAAELGADTEGIILTTSNRENALSAKAGIAYAGQEFTIQEQWNLRDLECPLRQLGCVDPLRWVLFRETVLPPRPVDTVTLWRPVHQVTDE